MLTISLSAEKEQTVTVTLNNQSCVIRLVQRDSGLYMDLSVDDNPIIQGIPCWYGNKMVRYSYLGFIGDFIFLDKQGESDPEYSGLGDRYLLLYLEESDVV